jgi:predicted RecB family nuclease
VLDIKEYALIATAATPTRVSGSLQKGKPKLDYLRRTTFGAYPAKDHLTCPEKTRKNVSYPDELKVEHSEATTARMAEGVVFEDTWNDSQLLAWEGLGWDVSDIVIHGADTAAAGALTQRYLQLVGSKSQKTRALRVRVSVAADGLRSDEGRFAAEVLTRAAVAAGVHVILGGRLSFGPRVGEIDMLVRCDWGRSGRKSWKYQAVDLKHHKSMQGTANARMYPVTSPFAPEWTQDTRATLELVGIPQLVDSMQLVHYDIILRGLGVAGPPIGGILGKEGVIVWRDLHEKYYQRGVASAYEIAVEAFDDMLVAIDHERLRLDDDTLEPMSGPEWKSACGECQWSEVCHDELLSERHVTLMPGMTPTRAEPFYEIGVSSTDNLSMMDHRTARLRVQHVDVKSHVEVALTVKKSTPVADFTGSDADAYLAEGVTTAGQLAKLDRLVASLDAKAVKALPGFIDQSRVFTVQRIVRARGVDFVSIDRAAIELDFDIEDDASGMCYLIGVTERIRTADGVKRTYIPFVTWEHTPEAEAKVFAEFWAYLTGTIDRAVRHKRGNVRAYHYTEHERRYFNSLAKKHAGIPGVPTVQELDDVLFESGVSVDMYPIVSTQVVWPTEDHSLKSLAKYLKFFWRDSAPGGANSVAWYRAAVADTSPDALELRQRILDYNEDDCDATHHIREWLTRVGVSRMPGKKLPSAADLDRRFTLRRKVKANA